MQELRLLLISLATVLLSSILLFIYFRSRVTKVEEKLEIMFNLIQNHAREEQITQQFVPYGNNVQNTDEENTRVNLIDVSEDEDESDSDESDSDSDDEMNNLVIDDSLLGDNIKKIELTVDSQDVLFENNTNQGNMNHLENVQNNIIVQKGLEETYMENNEGVHAEYEQDNEQDEQENEQDEPQDEPEDEPDEPEDEQDEPEDNQEAEQEDESDEPEDGEIMVDFTKLKVVDLRKMCSDNGISGYKSLKKKELIELLKNN